MGLRVLKTINKLGDWLCHSNGPNMEYEPKITGFGNPRFKETDPVEGRAQLR